MASNCLDIVALDWFPYLAIDFENNQFSGIFEYILHLASKKYKFCYKFRVSSEMNWGFNLGNGSFNGALGELQREEADIFGTASSYTADRYQAFDLSEPVDMESHSALMPYPTLEPDIFGFMKPYTVDTWISIMGVAITFFAALFILMTYHDRTQRGNSRNKIADSSASWTFGGIIGQTVISSRGVGVSVLLIGIWLLLGLVLQITYRSTLNAMLTTRKAALPFRKLSEIPDQDDLPFTMRKGSALYKALADSESQSISGRIMSKVVFPYGNMPDLFVAIEKGKIALLGPTTALEGVLERRLKRNSPCQMTFLPDNFYHFSIGMILPKNSTWTSRISKMIIRMKEFGLIQKMNKDLLIQSQRCAQVAAGVETRALSIEDFHGVFSFYATGLLVSFVILIMEHVFWKLTNSAHKEH